MPNLIYFLTKLTKLRFFYNLTKRNVLLFIGLIGFAIHSYYVLLDALNTDLIPEFSMSFSYLEPNKHLPVMIFCIKHNVDVDSQSITGKELNELTSYINESYLFEHIQYHDYDYGKVFWFPNQSNPCPDNLKIDFFFINRYKCYELHYQLNYQNIFSSYIFNIIRVKMNSSLEQYLFTYRTNDSYNLIDYYIFERGFSYYCNFDFMHENFYDRFQQLKSPMMLFKKNLHKSDVKNYTIELKDELKKTWNYSTTLVPLKESDFEYEIRNDIFEDLVRFRIEPREKSQPSNIDYERNYFNIFITHYNESNDGVNSLVGLKKVFLNGNLYMNNKDDYLGLMCNLLNALSVWLDLSLINLTYFFGTEILRHLQILYFKFKSFLILYLFDFRRVSP